MIRYIPHSQRIIAAALDEIFSRDVARIPAAHLTGMLRGYLSALDAIGAEL